MADLLEVRGRYNPVTDSSDGFLVVKHDLTAILLQLKLTDQERSLLRKYTVAARARLQCFNHWRLSSCVLHVTVLPGDRQEYFARGNAELKPTAMMVSQVVQDLLTDLAKCESRQR